MYAPEFEYHRAATVAEAIQLLSSNEDAKLIAGGHSLLPLLKLRLARPSVLVDIGRISELKGITISDGTVRIGALTTHWEIASSHDLEHACGIMAEAAGGIGDTQVRNRGTIGGSLAHLDPAAELPAVFSAHDAVLHLASANGAREVPIGGWSQGFMAPDLEPDELLTAIAFSPWPAGHGHAFLEMARRHGVLPFCADRLGARHG